MSFFNKMKQGFLDFYEKAKPVMEKIGKVTGTIVKYIKSFFSILYRYRSVFLTVATVIFAIFFYSFIKGRLPEMVGINLQSDGTFSHYISRDLAVNQSFMLTALSLVFVLISKKTLYPWLISMFTFVIPILILVTNNMAGTF